ncbi:MAG: hypothetical protein RLZZ157_1927 [Pseudomonadota bacterium]|jgi:hypothetical protein
MILQLMSTDGSSILTELCDKGLTYNFFDAIEAANLFGACQHGQSRFL